MLWMFFRVQTNCFSKELYESRNYTIKKKKKSVTLLKYYLESNPYETKSHDFEGFRSIIVFSGYDRDEIKFQFIRTCGKRISKFSLNAELRHDNQLQYDVRNIYNILF